MPLLFDLEQVSYDLYNINFCFLVVLGGLVSLSYIERRKRIRLVLSLLDY
jgi:hypothetical protein